MNLATWLALGLLLLWLFLIFPSRASGTARAPFENRAYAHRGLSTADQSVPENSLPAFHRAVEAGYGVELDVQLTRDGYIVVLHDDDLKRACGVEDSVCDHTLAELRAMKLFGTEEEIPLFADVLRIFDGKQPLIVELKYGPNWKELCAAVKEMLDRKAAGITNRAMLEARDKATDADHLLIAESNARRLKRFSEVAKSNGVSLETAQRRHAAKMRERIPAGSGVWFQDDAGKWQQK